MTPPLWAVTCLGDAGGRPCGANLLHLLAGDAESETVRLTCPLCDTTLLIHVKREPVMAVVEATAMPEATSHD